MQFKTPPAKALNQALLLKSPLKKDEKCIVNVVDGFKPEFRNSAVNQFQKNCPLVFGDFYIDEELDRVQALIDKQHLICLSCWKLLTSWEIRPHRQNQCKLLSRIKCNSLTKFKSFLRDNQLLSPEDSTGSYLIQLGGLFRDSKEKAAIEGYHEEIGTASEKMSRFNEKIAQLIPPEYCLEHRTKSELAQLQLQSGPSQEQSAQDDGQNLSNHSASENLAQENQGGMNIEEIHDEEKAMIIEERIEVVKTAKQAKKGLKKVMKSFMQKTTNTCDNAMNMLMKIKKDSTDSIKVMEKSCCKKIDEIIKKQNDHLRELGMEEEYEYSDEESFTFGEDMDS